MTDETKAPGDDKDKKKEEKKKPVPHEASDHLASTDFDSLDANKGIDPPPRLLDVDWARPANVAPSSDVETENALGMTGLHLRIENLDRDDPPKYQKGKILREDAFNKNDFTLDSAARMPPIKVKCERWGFLPEAPATPLHWKLEMAYAVGRYVRKDDKALTKKYDANNAHSDASFAYYHPKVYRFTKTWTGTAKNEEFTLFAPPDKPDTNVTYDPVLDPDEVLGGQGVLSVWVDAPGENESTGVLDYVLVRIGGATPAQADWYQYIKDYLKDYDDQLVYIVAAMTLKEGASQFKEKSYGPVYMNFESKGYGCPNDPRHSVHFPYPRCPPKSPFFSFDMGVGLTQQTDTGDAGTGITAPMAWSWKGNIKAGVHELFGKLRSAKAKSSVKTWEDLAKWGWSLYNGRQSRDNDYSNEALANAYGKQVTTAKLPPDLSLDPPD